MRLGQPPGGVDTRWGYYIDVAIYIDPAGARYELILTYLLHRWLCAQGHAGLGLRDGATSSSSPKLTRSELAAKIMLIQDIT